MTTDTTPAPDPGRAGDVSMTIEWERFGYAQHAITVERDRDSVQCMILTDRELDQMEQLIGRYKAALAVVPSMIGAEFTDPTGRTPEQQRAAEGGPRP